MRRNVRRRSRYHEIGELISECSLPNRVKSVSRCVGDFLNADVRVIARWSSKTRISDSLLRRGSSHFRFKFTRVTHYFNGTTIHPKTTVCSCLWWKLIGLPLKSIFIRVLMVSAGSLMWWNIERNKIRFRSFYYIKFQYVSSYFQYIENMNPHHPRGINDSILIRIIRKNNSSIWKVKICDSLYL